MPLLVYVVEMLRRRDSLNLVRFSVGLRRSHAGISSVHNPLLRQGNLKMETQSQVLIPSISKQQFVYLVLHNVFACSFQISRASMSSIKAQALDV